MVPPNGLPISRCERAANTVKMPSISRAKRSAAWACSGRWPVVLGCRPPDRTTPARNYLARRAFGGTLLAPDHTMHDGRLAESPAAHDSAMHHGPSAPRACVPPQHHGPRHDGNWHNALCGSRLIDQTNRLPTTLTNCRTTSAQLRPCRPSLGKAVGWSAWLG
jgi:hypothetical protein